MLRRFSLYSFLKNQKYYEPFLVLALLDKGLSFTQIGVLIGFRAVCINLLEVPSGAIADLYGRRRLMILSLLSYIVSFVMLGALDSIYPLFAAMAFFAIGEAFRTGTHKAMIFDWLAHESRHKERTSVYGETRSWGQIGSAVSVPLAAGIVLISGAYEWVFYACCVPYALGVINFRFYPRFLDGQPAEKPSIASVIRHVWQVVRDCVRHRPVRRLLGESMLIVGGYHTMKDYLQPVLKHAVVAIPIATAYAEERRSAVLVGAVYIVLHLLSALASRKSHDVADRAGGEAKASRGIIAIIALMSGLIILGLGWEVRTLAIAAFVGLAVCQNLWRPMLLTRLDEHTDGRSGATVLSVDSQAKSLLVMIAAPLLGLAVDHYGLWTVGVAGLLFTLPLLAITSRDPSSSANT